MIVIMIENVNASLRGELSRWLIEPKTGVFAGKVSAMIREKLWNKIKSKIKDGRGLMLWNTNNEQGFQMEQCGDSNRIITDWDGLQLITILKEDDPKLRKEKTQKDNNTEK
jgi:CRISPR-associated protein Cas2